MGTYSGKPLYFLRPACRLASVAIAVLFFLPAVPGAAPAGTAPVFGNASTSAAASAIPPAEIALRATEVSGIILTYAGYSSGSADIESIRQALPQFSGEIDAQFRETMLTLRGYSTLAGLQSRQQSWHQNRLRATNWLKLLTARAGQLENALNALTGMHRTWTLTLESARASNMPEPVIRQAAATLAAIASARDSLRARGSDLLGMQSSLARDLTVCGKALEQIAQVQQHLVRGTFLRDSPPLWDAPQWIRASEVLPSYLREVDNALLAEIGQYCSEFPAKTLILTALACVVLFLFFFARRRLNRWEETGRVRKPVFEVFDHPYSASFTIILLALTGPFSQIPNLCKGLLQALSPAPMILLVRRSLDARTVRLLIALSILFACDMARQAFSGIPTMGQAILVFESIVAMAVAWMMMTGKGSSGSIITATRPGLPRLIGSLLLPYFAVCLVAGATGYTNLARLLGSSVIAGGYLGLALYASIRVLGGLIAFSLRVRPLKNLLMVQYRREYLESRLYLVLIWSGFIGWVLRFFDYMGFLEPSIALGKSILGAKFERGAISVSLGDALAFGITVWLSYMLSACLRFVLQEEVYPRFDVGRGRSYAASSLLHYFILAIGFIVGIGLMGVNLTKVTVLAGALGVGIGFGLQGVVNNFVSGLILLFERPVNAGDSIEVGDLLGEVRRIGMRSSTIRTWRGADIIVPNSQLVSEKVTNWTLSDRKRRIDLPVGVGYGSDPKEVIRLLVEAAGGHPEILKDPAPQCFLVGYGDSSINFEVRVWTDQFNDWPRIRSDLAVAVYDAVCRAGMTFPFPQRDVHLVYDGGAGSTPGAPGLTPGEE